jgi:uncharacterized membrane protein YqhA
MCVMGITFNFILLFDAYEVLWLAGPVFMLMIFGASIPFFSQLVRVLRGGDWPKPEATVTTKWLNIINLLLIAMFVVIVFLKRSSA